MRSVKSVITIAFIMIITLAIGFVSFYNISASTKAIESESEKHLESLAIQNKLIIESKMKAIENRMEDYSAYLSNELSANQFFKEDNDAYIVGFLNHISSYTLRLANEIDDNLVIYTIFTHDYIDEVHELVLGHSGDEVFVELGDLATYEELLERTDNMVWYYGPYDKGEGLWTGPYDDPYLNEQLMTYSTPVYLDGKIIAIAGTDIPFTVFNKIIADIEVYQTGYAYLLNENYDFLVHPTLTVEQNVRTLNDGVYAFTIPILEAKENGNIRYFYETDKMMGFSRLYNGWILAVAPPVDEVFSRLNQTKMQMVIISLVSLIFILVISEKISIIITHPIKELTYYVESVNSPEDRKEIPDTLLSNRTEVGYLSQAIDSMNTQLMTAYEKAEKQNELLDDLVKERTQELLDANTELKAAIETIEETQNKLVKAEKHAALRVLIQNLAHRLNTPLGNTITAASYLVETLKPAENSSLSVEEHSVDYYKGLEIILNAQNQMSEIVDSLGYLLVSYEETVVSNFDIKKLIRKTVSTFKMVHPNFKFDVMIKGQSMDICSYYPLIESLIGFLLLHSCNLRQGHEPFQILIIIKERNGVFTIGYEDEKMSNESDQLQLFDPFSSSGFNATNTGIELFIVYDIVTRGLSGNIEYDDNCLEIRFRNSSLNL